MNGLYLSRRVAVAVFFGKPTDVGVLFFRRIFLPPIKTFSLVCFVSDHCHHSRSPLSFAGSIPPIHEAREVAQSDVIMFQELHEIVALAADFWEFGGQAVDRPWHRVDCR